MRDLDETQELKRLEAVVPLDMAGNRIDQVMAKLFPDFSRSRITGRATVDGELWKPKARVAGGELLELSAIVESHTEAVPQEIPLDVVFEDQHLIVINKPAGLVVHPAAGNHDGTLLNGLLFQYPELKNLPRGGIVHRLDKDTTGLMVVARSEKAHKSLVEQLSSVV